MNNIESILKEINVIWAILVKYDEKKKKKNLDILQNKNLLLK